MAYIDDSTHLRRMTALRDYQARDLAARRLDEIEARVAEDRQRRGMQPITSDTGQILGWVHTWPQMLGGR